MNIDPHDDVSAAEYVLGTLDDADKRAFEARIAQEPALQHAIAKWQRAFFYVDIATPGEVPPERVWRRIASQLPGRKRAPIAFLPGAVGWLVAAMLACVLVINYVQRPADTGLRQPVAVLNAADGKSQFVVFVDSNKKVFDVAALNVSVPDQHSLQLWALAGNNPPVSLGVLAEGQDNHLVIPTDVSFSGSTLAISLEPKGGSKQAGPSGPVVYSGTIRRL